MCSLEVHVVSEFLNSVLPLELARDIQNDLNGESELISHLMAEAKVVNTMQYNTIQNLYSAQGLERIKGAVWQ